MLRKAPELIFRRYVLSVLRRPIGTLRPNQVDQVVVLAGIWDYPALTDHLVALRRRGVHVTQVIYDLIPLRKPQFCSDGQVDRFGTWLERTPEYAWSYITISDYVRHDLLNYLEERGLKRPVAAIPLAHELRVAANEGYPSIPAALAQQPYALCVGTIEVRKNHLSLCRAWEALLHRHPSRVPLLAIAGKWGWKCDELRAYLARTNFLDGNIVIIESASDQALHRLYSNALFCVFPSKAEGWGLPVGEAAWCGTPTVFSRSTSLVEILPPGVADMFDPDDPQDMLRVLESYIADPRVREEARERLKCINLRTWSDVGDDYAQHLMCEKLTAERQMADLGRGRREAGASALAS